MIGAGIEIVHPEVARAPGKLRRGAAPARARGVGAGADATHRVSRVDASGLEPDPGPPGSRAEALR